MRANELIARMAGSNKRSAASYDDEEHSNPR